MPEIEDNDSSVYTPTETVDILSIFSLLATETTPVSDAIERGYLRETTYEEAYKKVGQYDKYKQFITLSQLNDVPLYQVTPKGNAVVGLIKDTGPQAPEEKRIGQLKPALQF